MFNPFNNKARVVKYFTYLSVLLFVLSGCMNVKAPNNSQSETLGNPTPADFLKNDDANIFVLKGIVYSDARSIEWVKDLDYSIGEQTGEITKQASKAKEFVSGTSNKLPVGTKIYETDKAVYIAVVEGEEIPFIPMIEG